MPTHSPGKSHSYPSSSFLQSLLNRFHEQNGMDINNNHKGDRNKNSNDDDIILTTTTSSTSTTGSTSNAPLRMSILGPSQSAKTSLAMDFAYSIAASTSADKGRGGGGIVLFVIPECKRSLLDFPMHCHNVVANDVVTSQQSCWNQSHQQGLENIQIKYMASVTDLVYFLASCLGGRSSSSSSTRHKTTTSSSCQKQGGSNNDSSGDDHVMMEEDSDSDNDCNNSPEDEYKGDRHCRLDAIVIDDLDYYIQPQQPQQQEHDDDIVIHDGATNHHDGESVAVTATASADASNIASSSMTTSLEVQKLIQLLALIADTANWMDETTQRRKNATPYNQIHQSSSCRDYNGVHVLTCINTHRLPLGTSSLSQVNKGIMSMMQNYTPTIVYIEQITRLMEYHGQSMARDNDRTKTTTTAAVTPTTINLDTFFHLKSDSTSFVSKGDKMVKLLSSWKAKLYHQDQGQMERNFMDNYGKRHAEYKESFESKFCVAIRCWYTDGMEKNLFSYMDESSVSSISRNDEEDDEEHELYWAL